ncbi:O-antigen polysaccharide polymerase Wzy [Porticoccaceae bacterium]|nr:O-antigen polysaccharide polymerase Wzy [Porticoccaceae bacterium]
MKYFNPLLIYICAFSTSIFYVFDLKLFLFWNVIFCSLISLILAVSTNRPVISVYTTLFCIFFVGPLLIFGPDFLQQGNLFKNIYLIPERQLDLLATLSVYFTVNSLAIYFFYWSSGESVKKENNFFGSLNYLIPLYVLCAYFVVFNIREMFYVFEAGYQVFQSGGLEFKKSFIEFYLEMTLLILIAAGARSRNLHGLVAGLLYALTFMVSGQRGPGFFLAITLLLIYYPFRFVGFRIVLTTLFGILIGVPILMFVQALRVFGLDAINKFDLAFYYYDIWNVVAYSFDTIKAVFWYSNSTQMELNITPFAKFMQILDVAFNRAFGLDIDRTNFGFAREFSSMLNPELFAAKGVTFASSGIAESYYFMGILGVIFYSIFVVFISRKIDGYLNSDRLIVFAAILIFTPKFFVSIRNELFGWIYEGAVHFLVLYILYTIIQIIRQKNKGF